MIAHALRTERKYYQYPGRKTLNYTAMIIIPPGESTFRRE